MALWDKISTRPQYLNTSNNRTVIGTEKGWVRRIKYTDSGGNVRVKDEVLVAIGELADSTNLGFPNIRDVFHSATAVANNVTVTSYLVFDEPISIQDSGVVTVAVANTVSGNAINAASNSTVEGADNWIAVKWTPTIPGTYKIEAQLASNTQPVVSLNAEGETANLYILPESSNSGGTVTVTSA